MALTDDDIWQAEKVMRDDMTAGRRARVVLSLDNGVELAFPPDQSRRRPCQWAARGTAAQARRLIPTPPASAPFPPPA